MHPANPIHSPVMLALFASMLDAQRTRCRIENMWLSDPQGMADACRASDLDALGQWEADLAAAETYYATN